MAAKLGQGAGKYDDLSNWSGWVMENWQAGLGKREADEEGFLYAELETRFQGQLCLPLYHETEIVGPAAGGYQKYYNPPVGIDTILSMSTTSSPSKLAFKITQGLADVNDLGLIWVMLFNSPNQSAKFTLYTNSGGQPGTVIYSSNLIQGNNDLCFEYWRGIFGSATFTSGSDYWLVIEPANSTYTIELPVYDHGSTASTRKQWNGSSWADSRYSFFFWMNGEGASYNYWGAKRAAFYDGAPHFVSIGGLFTWNGTTMVRATTLANNSPKDMIAFGDLLFIAHGDSANVDQWDGTTCTNLAFKANIFTAWNGYLWRAHENDVYYSVDGSTWTGPIQIGPDGYTVTGMAGLGDDMYVATDEAFYRIGAGDLVFGVMRWNNISLTNGKNMINHQGSLFIPTYSDLLRYGGAELMSASPMKDEGLPQYKQGRCVALMSHNYWLFAVVTTDTTQADDAFPVILAYNDQGWHYIGKMFQRDTDLYTDSSLVWDTTNDLLWVTGSNAIYRYSLPVDHQNPYKDNSGNMKFFPGGVLETPWFHSGLKEIYKDCESVYVTGENITSARPVKVYWKDDDSTAWELLGTVTSNRQELRWSDYTTRPNTRQIKLALVMHTDDYTESPRVDAVRLKFMNMVTDRWRWTLSIPVSDEQEMLDGDINIYTKEHQRTHLEALARSVPPVIFEDVDGVQYEVKVLGASEQVEKYEYFDEAPNFTSVYSFTIEQATTTTYN